MLVVVFVYMLKTCRIASASVKQAHLAERSLGLLQGEYNRARSAPDIKAHEPPSVVLESDARQPWKDKGIAARPGKRLWLYVPLTFTNTGSTPGVVSNLDLRVHPTRADGSSAEWRTDWPGSNGPVEKPEWEPNPIEVPPHGSAGRTTKLYVRDYDGGARCTRCGSPSRRRPADALGLRGRGMEEHELEVDEHA
jgi:hypothetical protein